MKKVYIPLFLFISIAFGFWLGGYYNFNSNPGFLASSSKKEKLNRLIDYIDYEYVDDVNTDSIVDVTVNKILENLDPHSVYIPQDKLASVTETMNGEFVGIGVNFYLRNDSICVIKAIKDGPSDKVGLQPGDKIVYANKDSLFGKAINNEYIVSKLKGEQGSSVDLTVYRAQNDSLFTVTLKRDLVPIKSVPIAYMVNDSVGYIKIQRFAETTYKEFYKSLTNLKSRGMSNLIIDVRGNPGGLLDVAKDVIDELLEKGSLILYTKNKRGQVKNMYAEKRGTFESGVVYVLIDEESASASEILAGALQDNDKGTIVGRRSFGKGLVQREMKLGDGSAVRLTVSRYYTPTGRSIQRPYGDESKEDYYDEYTSRYLSGELSDSTQIKVNDSLKYTTPKGKIVYGGGGIIPDVYVPVSSDKIYRRLKFVLESALTDNFIFDVLEKDRTFYNALTSSEIETKDILSETLINDYKYYVRYRTRGELDIKSSDYDGIIERYLRSQIASQLKDENLSHKLIKDDDEMIARVLKQINY